MKKLALMMMAIQGDYRGPRDASMVFLPDQIRNIRLDLINLQPNIPAQIQIFVR